MKKSKKTFRYPEAAPAGETLHEAALAEPPSMSINVRSAKDQLSSLLEEAALGNEVIITSDGQPKARLVSVRARRKAFRVDWEWLRSQPLTGGPSAEQIIRDDRDGRA
jgi:prevent-host-death family protein